MVVVASASSSCCFFLPNFRPHPRSLVGHSPRLCQGVWRVGFFHRTPLASHSSFRVRRSATGYAQPPRHLNSCLPAVRSKCGCCGRPRGSRVARFRPSLSADSLLNSCAVKPRPPASSTITNNATVLNRAMVCSSVPLFGCCICSGSLLATKDPLPGFCSGGAPPPAGPCCDNAIIESGCAESEGG